MTFLFSDPVLGECMKLADHLQDGITESQNQLASGQVCLTVQHAFSTFKKRDSPSVSVRSSSGDTPCNDSTKHAYPRVSTEHSLAHFSLQPLSLHSRPPPPLPGQQANPPLPNPLPGRLTCQPASMNPLPPPSPLPGHPSRSLTCPPVVLTGMCRQTGEGVGAVL